MNNSPNNSNKLIIPIVLLVVGLSGGFVAGTQYQKGKSGTSSSLTGSGTQAAGARGGPGGMNQNGSMGTVTAISASSISVKDQRASTTKTYSITSSTAITDSGSAATYSDITVGDTVFVMASSSTSTTATQILINPTMGASG